MPNSNLVAFSCGLPVPGFISVFLTGLLASQGHPATELCCNHVTGQSRVICSGERGKRRAAKAQRGCQPSPVASSSSSSRADLLLHNTQLTNLLLQFLQRSPLLALLCSFPFLVLLPFIFLRRAPRSNLQPLSFTKRRTPTATFTDCRPAHHVKVGRAQREECH